MRKFVYFVFAFFVIFENFATSHEYDKCLEKLIQICDYNMTNYENAGNLVKIKFAPIVKVGKKNAKEWRYEFINEKYKDDTYFLNSNSKISASNLENNPIDFESKTNTKISYDSEKGILFFKGNMTKDEKDTLLNLSPDKSYRQAIEKLYENSNVDSIWLYTSFRKDENGKIPNFFWNLIVSPEPTVSQRSNADGYIVNLSIADYKNLDHTELSTLFESTMKDRNNKIIFTNISSKDLHWRKKAEINEIWNTLLEANNMEPVYCESNKQGGPKFDYTFYFSKVSVVKENISLEHGYRISNSKIVTAPGTVLGFAFDNQGVCLGFTEMEVKVEKEKKH